MYFGLTVQAYLYEVLVALGIHMLVLDYERIRSLRDLVQDDVRVDSLCLIFWQRPDFLTTHTTSHIVPDQINVVFRRR